MPIQNLCSKFIFANFFFAGSDVLLTCRLLLRSDKKVTGDLVFKYESKSYKKTQKNHHKAINKNRIMGNYGVIYYIQSVTGYKYIKFVDSHERQSHFALSSHVF